MAAEASQFSGFPLREAFEGRSPVLLKGFSVSERTLSIRPRTADKSKLEKSEKASGQNKGQNQSLQDAFLNLLRREKTPVTIFLVKGVKLQGTITWFDNFSILLRRDGRSQLVYKHAVSTILASASVDAEQFTSRNSGSSQRLLQDVFLTKLAEAAAPVTVYLMNGVMLEGRLAAYDLFAMLLERDGQVQLAYKHAVSTIQPEGELDLQDETEDDR